MQSQSSYSNWKKGSVSAVFSWLFFAVSMGFLAYTAYSYIEREPCRNPIEYSIGTFDARFGVSRTDFLNTISSAGSLWEKAIGKPLFKYSPTGALKINLIYDERQLETQKNAGLQVVIDQNKKSSAEVKLQYASLNENYMAKESEYKSLLTEFEQRSDAYVKSVEYWNGQGGAPKAEFAKITAEKNELKVLQKNLDVKRLEVNRLADEVNTMIHNYNDLVKTNNSVINEYNQSQFVGQEFNEGIYKQDANGKEIDIYEFTDKLKLFRVLAHELGHALTIGHNDNPKSIMYALNQSTNEKLSSEDVRDLKSVCKAVDQSLRVRVLNFLHI